MPHSQYSHLPREHFCPFAAACYTRDVRRQSAFVQVPRELPLGGAGVLIRSRQLPERLLRRSVCL